MSNTASTVRLANALSEFYSAVALEILANHPEASDYYSPTMMDLADDSLDMENGSFTDPESCAMRIDYALACVRSILDDYDNLRGA